MKKVLILVVFFFILAWIPLKFVHAEIESPQYKIVEPDIGIDDTDNRLETTLTSSQLNTLMSQGYVVRSLDKNSLRATLSHATLTFDSQSAEADNVGTVLTISSKINSRYQVLIQGQQGLKTIWGGEIPRTNCDSDCTINVAKPWKKIENVGFGYTLKGDDIATDFKDISYYRQLPDATLEEEPKTILSGKLIKGTRQSTIIFRVNDAKDQPDGTYQTIVNLFVVPL